MSSPASPSSARSSSQHQRGSNGGGGSSNYSSHVAETQQPKPTSEKCFSCLEMLKEVLVRSTDSRPHILLQSMLLDDDDVGYGGVAAAGRGRSLRAKGKDEKRRDFLWRQAPDGSLEVQIPAEPMVLQRQQLPVQKDGDESGTTSRTVLTPVPVRRRWSRLHPPEREELEILPVDEGGKDPTNGALLRHLRGNVAASAAAAAAAAAAGKNGGLLANSVTIAGNAAAGQAPLSSWNRPKYEWLQLTCKRCSDTGPEGGARAFVMGPSPLSIVVCSNRLHHPYDGTSKPTASQLSEMQEILTHELVHVYDVRKLHLDLRDCENLAYSEVRAAREAECGGCQQQHSASANHDGKNGSSWWLSSSSSSSPPPSSSSCSMNPLLSNLNPYSNYCLRSCVRQKALTATHNLFPKSGSKCLQRVFETAMADTRPFNSNSSGNASSTGNGPAQPQPQPQHTQQQQQQQQQQPRSSSR